MRVLEKQRTLLSILEARSGFDRDRFVFDTGDPLIETAMRPRIKWIRPIRRGRFVSPMLVHPKPGRRILADVWFKRIPARLRDLLIISAGRFDSRMKHYPIASIRKRFGVRRNNRRARLFVEPRMRRSDVRFQTETIDRHRRHLWVQRKINKQRGPPFSSQHFIEPNDTAVARDQFVSRLLA